MKIFGTSMNFLGWLVIHGEVGIERDTTHGRYPLIRPPLKQRKLSCFLRFSCENEPILMKILYKSCEFPAFQRALILLDAGSSGSTVELHVYTSTSRPI